MEIHLFLSRQLRNNMCKDQKNKETDQSDNCSKSVYKKSEDNTDNGRKTYNFLLAVLDDVLRYLVNFVTMVLKLPAQFCVVKDDVWKQP